MENELIRATERAHYLMQLSSYFTELTDLPGVRLAYTSRLSDVWYNQAYDLQCELGECSGIVDQIENYFVSRDRPPSIYLTPTSLSVGISNELEKKGYAAFDQEAWMFYDLSQPDQSSNNELIEIVDAQDKLSVFAEIYRRGLPGPEVEKYIESVIEGIKNTPPLVSIWYFLAYYKGEPIGMASLLKLGVFASVYAVATVPEHQRKGCARALTVKMIETARAAGAEHVYLQTGAGEASETAFDRLGFKTKFIRTGYSRQETISNLTHG